MDAFRFERIMVPTDLSPLADRAVRYAHGLAERFGAELHAVHVVREPSELSRTVTGVLDPSEPDEQYRSWLAGFIGEPGTVRRIEAVRLGTDIPGVIVAYAKKENIDLIVMGTHGRTGMRHLLMGSVAEQVLRQAPCPVLVVRPEGEKEEKKGE